MVYLIHFEAPYRHAKHYIGFTDNQLTRRTEHHRNGTGSRLIAVVNNAGIKWAVVRVWKDGTRTFERQLKNRGGASRICPACKGELYVCYTCGKTYKTQWRYARHQQEHVMDSIVSEDAWFWATEVKDK